MTIKTLAAKGVAKRAIGRHLGLTEGTVRYHLRRLAEGAADGRGRQARAASVVAEAIGYWMNDHGGEALNLAELHAWLVSEHDYTGSLRSVQRYIRETYPVPRQRARRRVETPPGAQAQVDWAEFRGVHVGETVKTLYAFHLTLSHSRRSAVVWSERQDQMSWLWCHNRALERLGGVPAVLRVDNTKTAVAQGGAVGRAERSLPALRDDTALPHRSLPATLARAQRQGRAPCSHATRDLRSA